MLFVRVSPEIEKQLIPAKFCKGELGANQTKSALNCSFKYLPYPEALHSHRQVVHLARIITHA